MFTGQGFVTLAIGLTLRVLVTYLVTFGNNLKLKERLFICIAWLPKATVQVRLVHVSFISVTEVLVTQWLVHVSFISVAEVLVTQWLVHVSFISVTEVLVTQWLVHVSFISVTEMLVTQWLVHVSFISVTEMLVTQWLVHVSFISVSEMLVTQWLVHVSFISVSEMLVTQWLVHVSFISVTEVLVTQWLVRVSFISVTEVLAFPTTFIRHRFQRFAVTSVHRYPDSLHFQTFPRWRQCLQLKCALLLVGYARRNRNKIFRMQTNPDTCGRGLRFLIFPRLLLVQFRWKQPENKVTKEDLKRIMAKM